MDKKKNNMPFPVTGIKKEETPTQAVAEFDMQQKDIEREQLEKREQTTQVVCKHEICLPIMAKGGSLFCGNCRKAVFVPQIGSWLPLDREYPEEWENQN